MPASLSPFHGVSIASDGSVSFNAFLTNGGNAIYRQKGGAAPEFISFIFSGSPAFPFAIGTGIISTAVLSNNGQTKILNNDSVFFATYLTSGAADFAVYLGTPGNVQTLLSTTDLLPPGARTILGSTPPQAAGHFVAFTAQPAAGRTNLLESDLTTGAITRVVSDNDPALVAAAGDTGNTVLASNFYLNESGQIAFETAGGMAEPEIIITLVGVPPGSSVLNTAWLDSPLNCGTIFLWSPSNSLAKVVTSGDPAPIPGDTFLCTGLNSSAPSPLNRVGQLAFSSQSGYIGPFPCPPCGNPSIAPEFGPDGVFLYNPGSTITEIAAASDTLPGESVATSLVPTLSIPVNSAGQVAFGAQLGTSTWGFYQRNGNTAQKVIENGDPVPGPGGATFGFPHFIAGQTDSGNVAFTAATSAAIDGLFLAPAGGAIQTLALDGGAAPVPGGGTLSLATALAGLISSGTTTVTTNSFGNFATINGESDVAFPAKITGGTTNSGYFRVLQSGPTAGTLQAVAWQGEAVPGGGTFNVIPVQNNTLINQVQNFALGPDGTLAFVNTFNASSSLKEGMFLARPDGTLVKVAATGDFLPGGGTLAGIAMSSKLAAGDAGKFAFTAGIVGGSARKAVFVTAIPPGTASTTTTLSQLQSPAVAQQPATVTATVTSSTAGSPTGTVAFFANGVSLGTGGLNSSGQATLATSSLAAGQDSIVAQYDGDSNFASGNSSPLALVVAGFAAPPSNLTVTPGQNLVIPMTVFAPAGSSMSFTLSCSGLPANTTCMFDTNPVTPGPSGTTVHLTFTTMAGSKLPPVQPRNGHPALPGFGLFTLLTALFAAGALVWRRAPRWRLVPCACLATFALALAIGGCGTSSYSSSQPMTPGTPGGPAAFTVTGTSGATTISAVVNVTVR